MIFFLDPDPISNVILYLDPFLPLVIPDPDPISNVNLCLDPFLPLFIPDPNPILKVIQYRI